MVPRPDSRYLSKWRPATSVRGQLSARRSARRARFHLGGASLTILPPKEEACRQLQLNLQAPPPAVLPEPDHRPTDGVRWTTIGLLFKRVGKGGLWEVGGKEQRMHLSVTLLLLHNSNINKNDIFALFLFPFTTFHSHFL